MTNGQQRRFESNEFDYSMEMDMDYGDVPAIIAMFGFSPEKSNITLKLDLFLRKEDD